MGSYSSGQSQDELHILPKVAKLSQDALPDALDDLNPYAAAILLQPLRLQQMIYRSISVCMSLSLVRYSDLLGPYLVMLTRILSPHNPLFHPRYMDRER